MYVGGWFGGLCGFGHPFYLMCPTCRQYYLEQGSQRSESSGDTRGQGQIRGEGHRSSEFQDASESQAAGKCELCHEKRDLSTIMFLSF